MVDQEARKNIYTYTIIYMSDHFCISHPFSWFAWSLLQGFPPFHFFLQPFASEALHMSRRVHPKPGLPQVRFHHFHPFWPIEKTTNLEICVIRDPLVTRFSMIQNHNHSETLPQHISIPLLRETALKEPVLKTRTLTRPVKNLTETRGCLCCSREKPAVR